MLVIYSKTDSEIRNALGDYWKILSENIEEHPAYSYCVKNKLVFDIDDPKGLLEKLINTNRAKVLTDLLEFNCDISEVRTKLSCLKWDSESDLVVASTDHLRRVLVAFLNEELSATDLEKWAELIEMREDIDYEEIADQFYKLANPLLTDALTKDLARNLLDSA